MNRYKFDSLKTLLAKATPARSGDDLAGLSASNAEERVAAQMALSELPLSAFLNEPVIPYESDEVTRLLVDEHDAGAFKPVAHLTVGDFRDWLLSDQATGETLAALAPGLLPEMAAAVSKIMRLQDLVSVAAKIRVVTRFRNTIGLPGRLSARLQPNHPTDDPKGIAASIIDGLFYGSGDAVIGINPVSDNLETVEGLLRMLDRLRETYRIPTQGCVLAHITTQMEAMRRGAPMDLTFQSIAGTEKANASFGVNIAMLREARDQALELKRGTAGDNVMYFETGQGSALSADAHQGVDQQTCEARAYGLARHFRPMLVNSVVGFIGPEYLYDGKQIVRAGLEDHFCGKLLGLPMGCDVCYTNHAEADQDDMDTLLTMLGAAGVNYIMGVPGADDIMLNYQSTSFHDALYLRKIFNLRPAPEFEAWLAEMSTGIGACVGFLEGDQNSVGRAPTPARSPLAPPSAGRGRPARNWGSAPPKTDSSRLPESSQYPSSGIMKSLRDYTPARVDIGRTGHSLTARELLDFQFAHAKARDAVHLRLDVNSLMVELKQRNVPSVPVSSAAPDRATYLHRPDLGRRLSEESRDRLAALKSDYDAAFVVADGLSALAIHRHAVPMLEAILPRLDWRIAPVAIVEQGRVAIGDEIGEVLGAKLAVVLIGERPGLGSPDSLGVYLTWHPRLGRTDAERNCISNIRTEGLSYTLAAHQLLFLMNESRRLKLSGVNLRVQGATIRAAAVRERSQIE